MKVHLVPLCQILSVLEFEQFENYVHVNIILDFPITYKNAKVLCQSVCACSHQTVNMVVFFTKKMKIPTQKGEQSCKMYIVVHQTKKGIKIAYFQPKPFLISSRCLKQLDIKTLSLS